jgi:hydrogenase expression/formation protein HypE
MPKWDYDRIQLAHGGGGRLMRDMIEQVFLKTFGASHQAPAHDAAVVDVTDQRLAFTTDSYVVDPLFFPGGDIGSLAVNGTVNDLAMSGASPRYLSMGFIIEEGFPFKDLWIIARSIAKAAYHAHVDIVTGDTKVVDKGRGHGIFINSSGIGSVPEYVSVHPSRIQAGDAILLNGDIARHGMAIMAVREGLDFESNIKSDCAPLTDMVQVLFKNNVDVHCLRDLTRGGLATVLNEISEETQLRVTMDEVQIPIHEDVAAACEILGLDPLYVANEGKCIAIIKEKDAPKALDVLQRVSSDAAIIGRMEKTSDGPQVVLTSKIGSPRIIGMLSGEQLPRIC